jgi:hypothetical protein
MPLFGALAVKLFRRLYTIDTYNIARLSFPAAGLCLACALLVIIYLSYYTTMPRALFIACVAAGLGLGICTLYLYGRRQARATSGSSKRATPVRHSRRQRYKAMQYKRASGKERQIGRRIGKRG